MANGWTHPGGNEYVAEVRASIDAELSALTPQTYSDHYTAVRYVTTSGGTCREGARSPVSLWQGTDRWGFQAARKAAGR